MRLYGKKGSLRMGEMNNKYGFFDKLNKTHDYLFDVQFCNTDYKKFFKSYSVSKGNAFIYSDPPYIGTTDNYSNSFTDQDSRELFETLISTGCKFAISEFDNPTILDLAKQHDLKVITIGERQNLKNRRTEILIVNYETPQLTLFE